MANSFCAMCVSFVYKLLTIARPWARRFALIVLLVWTGTRNAAAGTNNPRAHKYMMYCARCHGDTGHGNGPAAHGLATQPCNFRDCAEMSQVPDATLFRVIKGGGDAAGLSSAMPAWGGALKDRDISDLISYLRSLCIEEAGTH